MLDWTPELKQRVSDMIGAGRNSAEIAAVIAGTPKAVRNAAAAYSLGPWKATATPTQRQKAPPADFTEQYHRMNHSQLREHYSAGNDTVRRWVQELGLPRKESMRSTAAKPRKRFRKPAKPGDGWKYGIGPKAPVDLVIRDDSPAGEAQRYLQRFGPVYRATATERAQGYDWRRGNTLLTDAQLIERADALRRKALAA